MTYEEGIAAGMRRAVDECKRLAESYTRSLAHYADDDPQWAKIKWGAAAVTVAAENILAAIPAAGAWEPPADRADGYECFARNRITGTWKHVVWKDESWTIRGEGFALYQPDAFTPLPPAPAGEGEP